MKIDRTKLNVIGIDRIEIYVDVISVNTKKNPNVYGIAPVGSTKHLEVYDVGMDSMVKLNSLKYIKNINGASVETKEEDNVKYELKLSSDKRRVGLKVVLPRIVHGTTHNAYNVPSEEEALGALKLVREELTMEGIILNPIEEWEVFVLEVNKTIETDKHLVEYRKKLNWLFDESFNKGYIDQLSDQRKRIQSGKISNTVKSSSKRVSDKFYDKSSQLEDQLKIIVDIILTRFEITYNKEGIQRAYGSNKLEDVLGIEKMHDNYNKRTAKLIEYLNEFTEETIKFLEQQFTCANYKEVVDIKSNRVADDVIFDNLFLAEAMRRVYKKENNKNFSRDIKKLLKNHKPSLDNNYKELSEILIAFNSTIEAANFDNVEKYLPKNK